MDEIKCLIENFNGKIYDLCYEILERSENKAEAFEYTCKNLFQIPEDGNISIDEHFSEEEIDGYESIYDETVKSLLHTNIKKCDLGLIDEKDFYKSLWDTFDTMFTGKKEKAFAFYCTVCSQSIPYQYIGKPLLMSNERFRELTEQNRPSIEKILYIHRSRYDQRTSRASLLLNCLDEIEDYESKVVVLSHAITLLGKGYEQLVPNSSDLGILARQLRERTGMIEALESEAVFGD